VKCPKSNVIVVQSPRSSTISTTTAPSATGANSIYVWTVTGLEEAATIGSVSVTQLGIDTSVRSLQKATRQITTGHISFWHASTHDPKQLLAVYSLHVISKKAPSVNAASHSQTPATGTATSASKAPGATAPHVSTKATTVITLYSL
jgi:hypothetical protein